MDRYILKQFLGAFVFTVFIIVAVIVVIHYSDNADDFAEANLSAKEVAGYYLDYIPWIANYISPLTMFIATVFVTSKLAGRTEIIAILSSGISFKRMLVPYMTGAVVIAIGSLVLTGWVIPQSNKDRVAFEVKYLKSPYKFDKRNYHSQLAPDVYFYLTEYNNQEHKGQYFTLEKVRGTELVEKLTAQQILWDAEKKKWSLSNWKLHHLEGYSEKIEKGIAMDTALAIHPSEFENDYKRYDAMTIPELEAHITKLHIRGATNVAEYEIEKYIRFTSPFAMLILTFLGVIVSSRKHRGGVGFQLALGFFLAFFYIVVFTFTKTIAQVDGFDPAFMVWIPNLIFAGVSVLMYRVLSR
ncbi:membrane protein, putative [Fulvivirga imtechensis AK7]|uniref:Membrane protein, putative n=1 Tax=Fulvivirga imtechensis AK7 TaxID=1237149 RepID=L8JNI7_9BACT|nr:membrane protein, putative [Fulvivirga imtechensis AK7]